MLNSFSVTNFKSFRETASLSMAPESLSEKKHHLIQNELDAEYLPIAAIYGPNGGGKSNLLLAIKALISRIIIPILFSGWETKTGKNILSKVSEDIVPFRFNEISANQPTEFELIFDGKVAEYKYYIKLNKKEVLEENLSRISYKTKRSSNVFERNKEGIKKGMGLKGIRVPDSLSDNLPFLTYLGMNHGKNELIKDIIDWMINQIDFVNFGVPMDEALYEITSTFLSDEKLIKQISNALQKLDLDITDLRLDKLNEEKPKIYTIHTINGKEYELNLEEESRGTKKLFLVLPYLLNALENGSILVVDEIDAKLHPVLMKYIIELFTNPKTNKNGAQLIYTSQDVINMTHENFRRDEIWFTAKNKQEESNLYALSDFIDEEGRPVRNDAVYYKQYLQNRYGANPCIQKIKEW